MDTSYLFEVVKDLQGQLQATHLRWITAQTYSRLLEMDNLVSYNPSDFLELNELGAQSQILFGVFYGDCAHTHVE